MCALINTNNMKTISDYITEGISDDIFVYLHHYGNNNEDEQILFVKNDDNQLSEFVMEQFRETLPYNHKSKEYKYLVNESVQYIKENATTLSEWITSIQSNINKHSRYMVAADDDFINDIEPEIEELINGDEDE